MRWQVVAALVSGCGRVAFDPRPDGAMLDAVDAAPFDPAQCPATYSISFPSSNHRYRDVGASLLWPDAVTSCATDAPGVDAFTHLIVISRDIERHELTQLKNSTQTWIGISDRVTEATFLAITREDLGAFAAVTNPPWETGEPNNQNDEDCGELDPAGFFNDNSCIVTSFPFVCECDGYSGDPSRY